MIASAVFSPFSQQSQANVIVLPARKIQLLLCPKCAMVSREDECCSCTFSSREPLGERSEGVKREKGEFGFA